MNHEEALARYKEEVLKARRAAPLSDEQVESVAGGVGGDNEATCPVCGTPMQLSGQTYGSGVWVCGKCGAGQLFTDAETIEMIRYMEAIGYPGIEYPVWWNQVKK